MKFKDINWKEWEECSEKEYVETNDGEGLIISIPDKKTKSIYFKKKWMKKF